MEICLGLILKLSLIRWADQLRLPVLSLFRYWGLGVEGWFIIRFSILQFVCCQLMVLVLPLFGQNPSPTVCMLLKLIRARFVTRYRMYEPKQNPQRREKVTHTLLFFCLYMLM